MSRGTERWIVFIACAVPFCLFVGAGLLIAILKDDLFDIDRVIWVSSLYFITTGFAFVLFSILEEGLSALLGNVMAARSSFTATAVSGVVAAAAFHPVRQALDRALTRMGLEPPEPEAP
ncbi:MAG TPA: hypothetical protein VLA36_10300 [Longimicrobiales bacterium]|nr:hypothetical protein [Longimicrobiales bacterium]